MQQNKILLLHYIASVNEGSVILVVCPDIKFSDMCIFYFSEIYSKMGLFKNNIELNHRRYFTYKNKSVISFKCFRDVNDARGVKSDYLYIPYTSFDKDIIFQLKIRTITLIEECNAR